MLQVWLGTKTTVVLVFWVFLESHSSVKHQGVSQPAWEIIMPRGLHHDRVASAVLSVHP